MTSFRRVATRSFRDQLLLDLTGLLLLTGLIILAITWWSGQRTIRQLSRDVITETTRQTEVELETFFGDVQDLVRMGQAWSAAGMLDATDAEAMNELFVPILEQHPQLSSMMVADSNGAEYLLLRDPLHPEQWTNRLVQADRWGPRAAYRQWNDETGEVSEYEETLDYDPRRRIWYEQALTTSTADPIFWTKPVIFFITKDPGITAATQSSPLREAEQPLTQVVAFDLLLMDISRFTSQLTVTPHGKAFVLAENAEDGALQVVGLPRDKTYVDDVALRDALVFAPPESAVADRDAELPPPQALPAPEIGRAVEKWQARGRTMEPVRFRDQGQAWWGGLRPYQLGDQTLWMGVVVPEQDLSARLQVRQTFLLITILAVLMVGLLRIRWLARRFSDPIEELVRETERVRQGDLEPGPPIVSRVREIQRLADSHAQMREGLQAMRKLDKLERDLDIAREIQQSLLPAEPPAAAGFEVSGWNLPADQTGGDFYDWLELPDGRTLFTLADVSGHGIGPALIVAVYRAYMHASASAEAIALDEVINRVNTLLCEDNVEGRFVAAVVGLIDPQQQTLELLSAGQAPLLYYEAATAKLHNWDADDAPLGVFADTTFSGSRLIKCQPGDLLVLTTDGFFEAANAAGDQYGVPALEAFVREHHERSPETFIEELYRQVCAHAEGVSQADDLTALVIKCRPRDK